MKAPRRWWQGGVAAFALASVLAAAGCAGSMGDGMKKDGGTMMKDDKTMMEKK